MSNTHWNLTPADFISQGACDLCISEVDADTAVLLPGMSRAVCKGCAIVELTRAVELTTVPYDPSAWDQP